MNYRAFVKKQLMGGKLYKVRGFGIGAGSRPQMQLSNYHDGGTISHRAVVGPLIPNFEKMYQVWVQKVQNNFKFNPKNMNKLFR